MEKYKLKVTISSFKSALQRVFKYAYFIWDNEEDALACKELLEKADDSGNVEVEFVRFTEESPL